MKTFASEFGPGNLHNHGPYRVTWSGPAYLSERRPITAYDHSPELMTQDTLRAPAHDDISQLNLLADAVGALRTQVAERVVGQRAAVDGIMTAILAGGHALLVGVPGLAKTLMVSTVAEALDLSFNRVQFTPDLMPGDITGTELVEEDPATGKRHFRFVEGPIFAQVVLADEINRTPPKTQAALLQAMQERTVTVAGQTYPLPRPFFVLATQNPIEQEGTYPLPEAQLDRFLMHVRIGYPEAGAEAEILRLSRQRAREESLPKSAAPARISADDVFAARLAVLDLHFAPNLERYLIELVLATRDAGTYGEDLKRRIAFGASPRGSIALERCARAHAWLAGRDFVAPEDIHAVALDVLRHRVLLSFEAEAEGIDSDSVISALLERVPLP